MPSIGELSLARVRAFCQETERLLKSSIISDEERAELHGSDIPEEERTKDDWWMRYTEVRSYARRKERFAAQLPIEDIDEGPLEDTQASRPHEVVLTDGSLRLVRPASWARLMVVEDLWFWLGQLEVIAEVLRGDPDNFEGPEELLKRVRAEMEVTRGWLYTQVCAPGPAPLEMEGADPEEWARDIGPHDHLQLLNAWLEVHVTRVRRAELVIRQKYPVAPEDREGGGSSGTAGFAFLMASAAYREGKAPMSVRRDRDLPELMTTYALEGEKQAHYRAEAKRESEPERQARRAREAAAAVKTAGVPGRRGR